MTDVEFTKVLPPKTYSVPQRFGMSGILGMTSFMAVIFGSLKFFGAHPSVFLFFGLFAVVMCLVQMRYGGLPRAASIATGAIFLPLSIGVTVVCTEGPGVIPYLIGPLMLMTIFGAGLGYLGGACVAGVFLLIDMLESRPRG